MPSPIKMILVPVDSSKGALQAAVYAAGLAEALHVPLRLLFAFPKDPVEAFGIPSEAPRSKELEYYAPEAFERLRDSSAEKVFSATRDALGATTVEIQEEIIAGPPGEAIVEHAEGLNDVMIVMGSRGMGGLKQMLLGSVSQRVLHHAPCPVTVVR